MREGVGVQEQRGEGWVAQWSPTEPIAGDEGTTGTPVGE